MLCALFSSCLILGTPNDDSRHYTIVASIGLRDLGNETTDNGKGLSLFSLMHAKPRLNLSRIAMPYGPILVEGGLRVGSTSLRANSKCLFSARGTPMERRYKETLRTRDTRILRPSSNITRSIPVSGTGLEAPRHCSWSTRNPRPQNLREAGSNTGSEDECLPGIHQEHTCSKRQFRFIRCWQFGR